MTDKINIILVDDHALFREGLARLLGSDSRFSVVAQAGSGEEFLEIVESEFRKSSFAAPENLSRSDSSPHPRHAEDCYAFHRRLQTAENSAPPAKIPCEARQPSAAPSGGLNDTPVTTHPTAGAVPPNTTTVIFLDIDMPGIGGVEAARRALERWPELRIVALSMHGEQEFYMPMVEAGVKGFLLKSSDFQQVTEAVTAVSEGRTYFSQELMGSLVEALSRAEIAARADAAAHAESSAHGSQFADGEALTDREAEVLPLICEGLSNAEIADRLFISKRTVDKHRANILAKTGCKNTASLVLFAVRQGLISV